MKKASIVLTQQLLRQLLGTEAVVSGVDSYFGQVTLDVIGVGDEVPDGGTPLLRSFKSLEELRGWANGNLRKNKVHNTLPGAHPQGSAQHHAAQRPR